MMYLGDKAVGISQRFFLNWDKVAAGTEDLSVFDNIQLSDNIINITDRAFEAFPIKNITGNAVKTIQTRSFYYCTKLSNISFKNVESIGMECFRYAASNKINATPFFKLQTIGDSAFRNFGITNIVAPNVTQIGQDAFYSDQYLGCTDLGNKNIKDGFVGKSYCFEQRAECLVILRYGYVLPAVNGWFYVNCWLKNNRVPGTLYVWQDLIEGYQNHEVWGPLLESNGNQILPIEGSIYETHYGDGTLII